MTPRKIIVVLPAYNEEAGIGALLDDIAATLSSTPHHVIVVDDGSGDGTLAIAQDRATRMPLQLERHERNQGLGATLRDGLAAAGKRASDGDVIVVLDADGTHLPAQIPALVAALDAGADVAICSRFQRGSQVTGVPRHRLLLTVAARGIGRLLLGLPGVRDYTCGFRAYRAALVRRALERYHGRLVTEDGFAASMEILLRLAPLAPRFVEIPMDLRYGRKESTSKLAIGRTVARSLRLVARWRLASWGLRA